MNEQPIEVLLVEDALRNDNGKALWVNSDYVSSQVADAQEAERRRICMDIHDGPLQSLSVSTLLLSRAMRRLEQTRYDLAEDDLHHLQSVLADTASQMRMVLANLSAEIIEAHGLAAMLRDHAASFSELTGISVEVVSSVPDNIGSEFRLLFLQLARESLNNVRKHAKACNVTLSLFVQGNNLCLTISDDGEDFDPRAALKRRHPGEKLGLWSMRQRIRKVQGDLVIKSSPGIGTILQFHCPLPSAFALG
jgi:signal transduction histidine kinase